MTIGDVDDDGVTEIVTNVDGIIYVFDGISHSQEWASEDIGYGVWGSDLVVDDVDGDGTQEIIADGGGFIYVFAGTDHTQEWKSENIGSVYGLIVNDIDSDEIKEIVAGTGGGFIYVFDGVEHDLEWKSSDLGCAIQDIVASDVDNDNQMEIIGSGNGYLYMFGVIYPQIFFFDTGLPANPYPSIMGTHKGEIKPSCNINVSKLYTYPCAGTGGHTESIKLYENGDLIANGTWSGYQDDWHNITITPVILQAGHTYNYTIVTGSYPQIIHAKSKEVTGGTITCTSFVDANGKIYTDWIPTIRLE